MKLPLLCVLVMVAGVIPTQSGILNLNKMIQQMTGKTPLFSYWFYGCHCGPKGRGQPKDATDWCCKTHDCCYMALKSKNCRYTTDHYKYNMTHDDIHCSLDGTWCERHLCDCDKKLAMCLKHNLDTYNKYLRFYWRPRCQGPTSKC
ncbi:PREDICTED: group IID secretory phospholipase A2 [Elephantulus edwardii]|uniref:group IID secretory phospholipase A2 n=1 Tax=Elephantulus edwardii TaxID=28737 RepID=UPI0003F07476|nr:PREDICTED: group IID secretory phospholipase A2 [Elephantulus edwardii]